MIVSPDTDVFLIALSKSPLIQSHLYMLTGTGKHTRVIDIEAVAVSANEKFNKTECNEEGFLNALLACHCFTGCDSTSSFAGRRKIKPSVELGKNKVFINTFKNIGRIPKSSEMFSSLEQFVCVIYGQRSNENLSVNDARYNIYCQRQGKVSSSMLPPCHDVLIQHIKRVSYQTHIWQRSLDQFIRVDSPVGNGWFMDESRLDIQWMTCNPAPDEVRIERLFSLALTFVKTYNFKFNL